MIEFKAECGHTVRAKDDEAGGVVRCHYCGKEAVVPDPRSQNLNYLFREVEQPEDEPRKRRRRRHKPRRKYVSSRGTSRGIDLVAVIMRMCYAAFLLIVVIFVGDRYVLPYFRSADHVPAATGPTDSGEENVEPARAEPTGAAPAAPRLGLLTRRNALGLYVSAVPPSAVAYCVEESRAPGTGRIANARESVKVAANGTFLSVADGTYMVEVELPWNDPYLNDAALPYFAQYRDFRRNIEYADDDKRRTLLDDFFVPDGAVEVFIEQIPGQILIVRRFTGVRVRDGRSQGVRALFLPKIVAESHGFSIQALVDHYLPRDRVYGFDREHVQSELDYYEVPVADRGPLLAALASVGVAPYVTRDGRTRLFAIGIHDGTFAARILRDDAG